MTPPPAEVRAWNAGVQAALDIASAAAARIPASPHRSFASAVLIQLAHDGRHLLIGSPPEPMEALPPKEPAPIKPKVEALEMVA